MVMSRSTATSWQGRPPNIRGQGMADTVDRDKIKGYGKLKVVGSLEGTDLEIYGNLIVNGYL